MTQVAAPDRRTFLNISSFQVLAMFRRGLFYSYVSIYLRYFLGLSVTETTFFATFPMILNVVFQTFVWGVVSDKYQKRRTLIILGEASAGVITFLVWLAHTMPESTRAAGYVIIVGLSIVEIFWSMSNVAWSALISDLYPKYRRAEVQGKLSSVGAGGRIIGVWIGGLAYDGLARYYEGWGFDKGLLFFIASGVMLVSTIPMFFVPEGGARPAPEEKTEESEPSDGGRRSTYSKKFIWFLVALVLIRFGRNSAAIIRSQYLVLDEGFDVSSRLLSYIVNMQSVGVLLFGLVMGKLSKRFSDGSLLLWGSLAGALNLLGYAVATNLTLVFVSDFLLGVSFVVAMASSYSIASKLIPAGHRGRQFALYNATMFLSWGVGGTLIAGPVADLLIKSGASQVVAYKASFAAGAVLVFAGMVVFAFVNRLPNPRDRH